MRGVREAIADGRLPSGTRLPSSRALAADLGVARNTVVRAYEELTAEGWLVARRGSGTTVASRGDPSRESPTSRRTGHPSRCGRVVPVPRYDLRQGSPAADSFPRGAWLTSTRRALLTAPDDAFGPGDPRGHPALRREVALYLARARGVRTDPERVVICAGVSHALRLLASLRRGAVAVEEYGPVFQYRILEEAGLRAVPLPVDADGARVGALTDSPAGTPGTREVRTVLLTPAHQFPLGGPLAAERRAAVIEWARERDGLVLEDDYDGEFRYDRRPVGALQALDPERVVHLGSVSKSLSPALRLGWMVLPGHLVPRVLALKGEREARTSVPDQLTLADFLASGARDRHVRRMRERYRRRRDRLHRALAERVPGVGVCGAAAGLHAVVTLPPETDEAAVVAAAARRGVAVEGLADYRWRAPAGVGEDQCPKGLVVGYGAPSESAFPNALEALCGVLREALAHR
ncbi:PLP-dependent aminotransferase family protein [Streptomyces calidiresistens]|uniref:Aminotransferase class I/II-fold pyridoxal phosphate-dependent enzyme n=2 Tax=Streptomyces calidiresistens TaxID=1485586 RepID=A0A7W3XZ06_9ACTN|nr:aminotransferase class I/II-fold pyridoxal phosphate-dependent enzyme [Streptomyces calidiresistens]